MSEPAPKFWFRAKRYGWGWGLPVCWQGWAVLIIYFALLVAGIKRFAGRGSGLNTLLLIVGLTAALVVITYIKGEKPLRWRWGPQ